MKATTEYAEMAAEFDMTPKQVEQAQCHVQDKFDDLFDDLREKYPLPVIMAALNAWVVEICENIADEFDDSAEGAIDLFIEQVKNIAATKWGAPHPLEDAVTEGTA